MSKSMKKPMCILCTRGTKGCLPSLGGNEPFYLIPSEVKKDGLYQGKTWNVFCGDCFNKIMQSIFENHTVDELDFQNLFTQAEIEIIIEGKQTRLVMK